MKYVSEYYGIQLLPLEGYLKHHGIRGQKWGVRRFQNSDGSLTPAGKERYLTDMAETQKSNAKAIEKGNFDLKNDNRAQHLKDEITKTYSDYKKSVDEFEKKYSKEREAFYKDSKLFEKYQRKVAEEEWPSSGWKDTPEEKKRWIDMFLYEDFGQNDEAFEKYMRETGKDKKYEKDIRRNYEANDRFNKSISDYVDHVLGEYKNAPVKDIYFSKWDEKKRKWVPKDTTAGKLLDYKIMVSEMSSKKW